MEIKLKKMRLIQKLFACFFQTVFSVLPMKTQFSNKTVYRKSKEYKKTIRPCNTSKYRYPQSFSKLKVWRSNKEPKVVRHQLRFACVKLCFNNCNSSRKTMYNFVQPSILLTMFLLHLRFIKVAISV